MALRKEEGEKKKNTPNDNDQKEHLCELEESKLFFHVLFCETLLQMKKKKNLHNEE